MRNGVAECGGHAQGVVEVSTASLRMVRTSISSSLREQLAVLSDHDGLHGVPSTLTPKRSKHSAAVQLDAPQFRAVCPPKASSIPSGRSFR